MNFKAAIKRIDRNYCNTFLAEYLSGKWGYQVGYTYLPKWVVRMRKRLADWQESYDCGNALCTQSMGETLPYCPACFEYKVSSSGTPYCFRPPNACGLGLAAAEQIPLYNVIIVSVATLAPPETCVLNPPLFPNRGNCYRNYMSPTVNEVLIGTWTV